VMKQTVVELCEILGLQLVVRSMGDGERGIEKLVQEREEARKNKDFRRSDEIRQQLQAQGVELEDTPYGTKWKIRT